MSTETAAAVAGQGAAASARELHARLHEWLVQAAYPLWAEAGYDRAHGGFHERLGPDGPIAGDARRARVQVRQVYCFANAAALGWRGDPEPLVSGGLGFFLRHYRRADGLYRTRCAADGTSLDERAFLYDQAFVLLALAEAGKVLGAQPWLEAQAGSLMQAIEQLLRRGGPGFASGLPERLPLLANPHMHLLEAALAWRSVSEAPLWPRIVAELVQLALTRLIDARSGALLEHFGEDWVPLAGPGGHIVEPGHLFEWAWLLLRSGDEQARAAALRLVRVGEQHGIRRGITVNALLDDFSVHDGQARLWPQTERLKVAARLAVHDPQHWPAAAEAGRALLRYLDVTPRGLWYDTLTVSDRFVSEPAPASSFYHVVAASLQLGAALDAAPGNQAEPP